MTVVDARDSRRVRREEACAEAERRRTFALISHPDAGKSMLTEALTRRLDGGPLALFNDRWCLDSVARNNPKVHIEPLLVGAA